VQIDKNSNIYQTILKDTILINQKDSLNINSVELSQLSTSVLKIERELNNHLNSKKETFFGATLDTVFTVTVTIFIFLLGIIIERLIKKTREKSELKELKTYFIEQIEDCKRNILPQLIAAYKDFYQNIISIDKGYPTNSPKILSNNYNRLLNLETTQLFKSFKNKVHYHKYFSEIDFLDNLNKEIEKYHSIILKRNENLRNEISELDSEYLKLLYKFIEYEFVKTPNYKEEFSPYNVISYYLELFNTEIAKENKLTRFYTEIFDPIQKYLVAKQLNISHPIGIKVYDKGREFNNKYRKLRILVVETRVQYRYFVLNTQYSLDKLNDI
tara:strand:+ start:35 stop:1018 length:984 start_codon:yes stop_codon:yes gene_type:complete